MIEINSDEDMVEGLGELNEPPGKPYHALIRHPLLSASVSGLFTAIIVGGIQLAYSIRAANTDNYLSRLQTRIEMCVALSNHHRLQALAYPNEKEISGYVLVNESYLPELLDGHVQAVAISTNQDRFDASIRMGRELDMCMTLKPDFNDLKDCVNNATFKQKSKRVLDDVTREEDAHPVARWNPAC